MSRRQTIRKDRTSCTVWGAGPRTLRFAKQSVRGKARDPPTCFSAEGGTSSVSRAISALQAENRWEDGSAASDAPHSERCGAESRPPRRSYRSGRGGHQAEGHNLCADHVQPQIFSGRSKTSQGAHPTTDGCFLCAVNDDERSSALESSGMDS